MKTCTKCGEAKSEDEFPINRRRGKLERNSWCKACHRTYCSLMHSRKRAERREYAKEWRSRPGVAAAQKARDMARIARKKSATPAWLTDEHKAQIRALYAHADDCKVCTGEPYHVDHIVPISGIGMTGLHVPWNLQVIPGAVNIKKKNKYDGPDRWTAAELSAAI